MNIMNTQQMLENIGEVISFCGWINTIRRHKDVIFLDVRDFYGSVQVVVDQKSLDYSTESVVKIIGKIIARSADQTNKNDSINGSIEIRADSLEILSKSNPLPFAINADVSEELQLKYRFLHLRSERMRNNLIVRARVIQFLRDHMISRGFLEIQTPILTASSPEGARDYLVPSRLHRGKFYALPQSPQIFKQLLMVGGIARYFSVAPCFRDEDARKDRLIGEFYQLDFELAFTSQKEILDLLKNLMRELLLHFRPDASLEIKEITYQDSLEIYGSDKPDLRYGIEVEDFTEFFGKSECRLFLEKIGKGSKVKGLRVRRETLDFNKILKCAEENGFPLGYIERKEEQISGPLGKFASSSVIDDGEVIFFLCDKGGALWRKVDLIRRKICEDLPKESDFSLVFVTDFPMFERSANKWEFMHNPFSSFEGSLGENLENIKARQYDMVLNGYELASGSIRNTDIKLLLEAFKKCGYEESDVREKFKSVLDAFSYGVPPHGGAAIGIDRLLMIILEENNVRNVIAFPLNTNGTDPLTGAPTQVGEEQLEILGINVRREISR